MRRVLITLLLVGAGAAAAYSLNRCTGTTSEQGNAATEGQRRERTPPARRAFTDTEWDVSADAGIENQVGEPTAPYFDLGDLDFDAIREKTPDSLYWLMAAPTDDAEILRARAEAREARNQQYGKVVSSTATEEQIRDYYAYRKTLSEDYIEVLQLILDEHGSELSDRDVGLFELTISMHSARLGEIPAKLDDALQRKAEYDRVKQAWQEQREQERREGEP